MLDICVTGTGGTFPTKNRRLSSALMRIDGHTVLFDCGEGTQLGIRHAGYSFKSIDVICLTHFHADHVCGLPGLLLSMGNEGRYDPVLIIGPKGCKKVISSLCIVAPALPFETEIAEVTDLDSFYFDGYTLTVFPVKHAIPCNGYRIDIERVGKFDEEKAKKNNVPLRLWGQLQREESVIYDGTCYTRNMVLGAPRRGLSAVFCTDTRPCETLLTHLNNVDLAILEGMYGDDEKLSDAKEKMHMTFSEAATLAKNANASCLWLTHFSPSLTAPEEYLSVATAIFENTQVCYDGLETTLRFIS